MPIATGHEREELAAELEGKKIIEDVNNPVGPFGTKIYPLEFGPLFDGVTPFFLLLETGNVDLYEIEAPAVVKSYNDKRIVGCPGGEGEDEHDVVWFWLEKGKLHECPVCSQYFVLEVVGPGGPPEGHGDDRHELQLSCSYWNKIGLLSQHLRWYDFFFLGQSRDSGLFEL
ncbi:hypothetical protein Goshw_004013 [Gossypium schwendimanii]|uniref:Uncharacterized protein n=1 Tax=Gossypium schwendimanii TaxID=34291 RepID=A0A7J9M143_GOSSC|nr:hypothetical protein [Gossypium schwendimanii]